MNPTDADIATDLCYRCGYDLRATPDDRPCPECGLLAARSRRPSDELRYSRPRWLRGLAIGSVLVLATVFLAITALVISAAWECATQVYQVVNNGIDLQQFPGLMSLETVLTVIFIIGIFLLTRAEGYPPADLADRRLRRWLRICALVPLIAAILGVLYCEVWAHTLVQVSLPVFSVPTLAFLPTTAPYPRFWFPTPRPIVQTVLSPIPALGWASFGVITVGSIPLVLLLFLRLRGLARRARSAHLAEHCVIVGAGAAGSLIYFFVYTAIFERGLFQWTLNSPLIRLLTLLLTAMALLFLLWAVYLFARFTISFSAAARAIRA